MRLTRTLYLLPMLIGGSVNCSKSQDLQKIEDSLQNTQKVNTTESTWKDTRIINAQTTKVVDPNVMVFRIEHRFGDMGTSGGGFPTLYGFDVASDIYLSFEFGVIKNLELGFGRSEQQQLIDVFGKYKLLTQSSLGTPISLAVYEDAGVTPEANTILYAEAVNPNEHFADRLSYISELIVDRKFSNRISAELITGFSYRNYVLAQVNPDNGATDENGIPYVGGGARIRITKHSSVVFDYFYIISPFRTNNNPGYYNAFSFGYEIETGGHVFEINLSNASSINENNIVPYTTDSWSNGAFKLGFSINRAFNL